MKRPSSPSPVPRPRRQASWRGRLIGALATLGALSGVAVAAPGDLDAGFGDQGVLTRDVLPGTISLPLVPSETLALPGGKVVVAGETSGNDIFVTRLLADGSIDPSFGGVRVVDVLSGSTDDVRGLGVDGADRIVVAGRAESSGYIMRLTPSGAFDSTFDGDGKVIVTDPSFIMIGDVHVEAGGAIYAVNGGQYPSKVFRYLPTGAPDTAFGFAGVSTAATDMNDTKLAVDSTGRVVVAGSITGSGYRVYRLQGMSDPFPGQYDATFGPGAQDGLVESVGAPAIGSFVDVEVDSANRPVLLGEDGGSDQFELVRLSATDGALDGTFSTDGVHLVNPSGGNADEAADLEVSGSTIYVAGRHSDQNRAFLVSFLANGDPNLTFSLTGFVIPQCEAGATAVCRATDLSVSGDGVVYAGPQVAGIDSSGYAGRLALTGGADLTFGGDGAVSVVRQVPWGSSVIDTAMGADGSLYTLGFSGPSDNQTSWVFKQLPSGAGDPAFGSAGRLAIDLYPGGPEYISGLVVSVSGAVYVLGSNFSSPAPQPISIWKLNASGIDTLGGFGVAGKATLAVSPVNAFGGAIELDAAGRLVIGGGDSDPNPPNVRRVWIHRVDPSSGVFDPTFNAGTARFFDLPDDSNESLESLAILPDGSIVGGAGANNVMAVVKVTGDGQPFPGFGTAGAKTFPTLPTLFDQSAKVAASGGSVYLGATVNDPGGSGRHILINRLTTAGELDAGFASAGSLAIGRADGAEDVLQGIAADAAGRVLVVGSRGNTGPGIDTQVARITSAGQLDPAVNGGKVVVRDLSRGSTFDRGRSVVERAGKIVIVGEMTDPATGENRLMTAQLLGDPVVTPPVVTPPPAATGSTKIRSPKHLGRLLRSKFRLISGTTSVTNSGTIRRVQVAVRRVDRTRCRWLRNVRGSFTATRPVAGRCTKPVWITVRGTASWKLPLLSRLPAGRYEIRSRVVLTNGFTESRFNVRRNLISITLR